MDDYDRYDFQRAQLDAIREQTRSNQQSAIGIMFFLACILAPAAVTTGLWWLAGLAFVWGFFAWSGFRTFLLGAAGLALLKWGGSDLLAWAWWLLGAALLNSCVAQWRAHKWDFSNWWDY